MSGKITNQELASGVAQANLGFTPENTSNKGMANGYATLDANGHVPSTQLANGVTSVNGQKGAVTVQGYNPLTNPSAWIS